MCKKELENELKSSHVDYFIKTMSPKYCQKPNSFLCRRQGDTCQFYGCMCACFTDLVNLVQAYLVNDVYCG